MNSKLLPVILLLTAVITVQSAPSDRLAKRASDANPSEIFEDEYAGDSTEDAESRKLADSGRRKRWYDMWQYQMHNGQFQGFNTFSQWKPQAYQISRPYVIPVFGSDSRQYIYFPPQPVEYNSRQKPFNPGMPPDNQKPKPFKGELYLPPDDKPTSNMTIGNRLNFGDFVDRTEDQDDAERPVWGIRGMTSTRRPATRRTEPPPPRRPANEMVPTRPPLPPSATELPPLVHDISETENGGTNHLSAADNYPLFDMPQDSISDIRQTLRTTSRPRTTTTTTPRSISPQSGPSNCVWAVVSCCSASSNIVPENCFEQRGCPGPFWDRSPCDSEFARTAIEKALEFYNQGGRRV